MLQISRRKVSRYVYIFLTNQNPNELLYLCVEQSVRLCAPGNGYICKQLNLERLCSINKGNELALEGRQGNSTKPESQGSSHQACK